MAIIIGHLSFSSLGRWPTKGAKSANAPCCAAPLFFAHVPVRNLVHVLESGKAEFKRRVLVAGQVSIRMKFAKAFSSENIKRHILKFTIDLPFSG
jgi:hypothetical protein